MKQFYQMKTVREQCKRAKRKQANAIRTQATARQNHQNTHTHTHTHTHYYSFFLWLFSTFYSISHQRLLEANCQNKPQNNDAI